jgi:DNA-binding MarR family transcriptional regulator
LPLIPRKLLADGKLRSCSLDEYRRWRQQHPDQWLLRTPVLNGYVETVFDGEDRDEEVFRTYYVQDSTRDFKGATAALIEVDESHGAAVRDVLKEWFAASSFPNEPTPRPVPGEHLLHGATEKSALFPQEHSDPLSLSNTTPASIEPPPRVMNSLRFRLMRALGRKACTWYELRERLASDEQRTLRTLELAWRDGLILRSEGKTRSEPPTLSLSPKGDALLAEEKLSIVDQGGEDWEEDRHAGPAPKPWERHYCPLCGGPAMVTNSDRRGTLELGCERNPRWVRGDVACPAHWYAILHDGRIDREIIGRGDVRLEVDRRANRTQVYVRNEMKADLPELVSRDKLLSKLEIYLLFS